MYSNIVINMHCNFLLLSQCTKYNFNIWNSKNNYFDGLGGGRGSGNHLHPSRFYATSVCNVWLHCAIDWKVNNNVDDGNVCVPSEIHKKPINTKNKKQNNQNNSTNKKNLSLILIEI